MGCQGIRLTLMKRLQTRGFWLIGARSGGWARW
jgi:hypothetical protein